MIEIYLLEQLCAFAEHGTLSRAAEALHISQPALSRSMKKIEEELGVSLFDRDRAKISLNETGELAARLANEQLSINNDMVKRIKAFDRSRRSINVASCAPYPMSELMPLLQEQFGGMPITSELVELSAIEEGILNNSYQLGILNRAVENEELFCQRFVNEHLYISVAKNHRLAKKPFVKYEDFDGESFLLFEHIGFWKEFCHSKMRGANFIVQNSMESLEKLIDATDFPCFTTKAFPHSAPYGKNRAVIPIEEPEAYATFYIVCLNSERKKFAPLFNSARLKSNVR